VWFICIWYAFDFVFAAFAECMVVFGSSQFSQHVRASLMHMTAFDNVFGVVQPVLMISAAVALFLLRRQATYLFWSVFGFGLALDVFHFIIKVQVRRATFISGREMEVFFIASQVAVCLYCEHLKRNGTLG
jgi:hypothetical protein